MIMSVKESKIQQIFACLSSLTNGIKEGETIDGCKIDSKLKTTFTDELREILQSTFQKIEKYPFVKTFVTEFIQPCFGYQCRTCSYLKFFQLHMVLLRLLKATLTEEETKSGPEKQDTSKAPVPKAILSISQQNILQKSLQFAVALGILPNLIKGIGIPLSKRLKHANVLEEFTSSCSFYQKHIQISVCLDTLVTCLECSALQSIILSYHGSDILAAFLQLCHAPLKKVDMFEESSAKPPIIGTESMSFRALINSLESEEDTQYSEEQIMTVMLAHRKYFTLYFKKFLKQISHSLFMWDLLLFQGIPIKSIESEVAIKPPVWLSKICNQMLTDLILQNNGIAELVQVILDKAYDADIQTGKLDKLRIEAVARLIAYNPVRHISLNDYMQRLCKQVFVLLHLKDSMMNGLLKHVASFIILQFCERDMKLAEQYFLEELLNPFFNCVHTTAKLAADVLIDENKLTTSIEDLHQIFVVSSNPLCQKYMKLLFPFFHCLCEMYFFLLKGKSYLKSNVKDLINTILKNSSDDDALSLLTAASLLSSEHSEIYINKVSFVNGDEGGIVAVPKVEEDFVGETVRYHAILEMLGELQNKNLIRSYILVVLKEFSAFHLESEDLTNPENLKAGVRFNILLQELSEWNVDIGEALMSNISEVINILMTLLSNTLTGNKDSAFYEKIVWAVVMILSSIFESVEKLTSEDWSSLKKCLPVLEKIQKSEVDSNLKEIAFAIMVLISTHGVAGENDLKMIKEFQKFGIDHPIDGKMPELDISSTETANSTYVSCMKDIKSNLVHIKGHGVISLVNLLKKRDDETLQNKTEILETLMKCLEDEDSYVFLPTINALSELAFTASELVVPFIANQYRTCEEKSITLKLGEVLLKVCNTFGESSLFMYKDMLLHTFLTGTKRDDSQIRASSLSNLGQVCMCLKFQLSGHWVQEILNCVLSYLNADPDLEVRRCAVMVVYLLLKGVDKNMLMVLENEIKTIYSRLRIIYEVESDDVIRLHSQLALEEINEIMKKLLIPKIEMIKEIRILQ